MNLRSLAYETSGDVQAPPLRDFRGQGLTIDKMNLYVNCQTLSPLRKNIPDSLDYSPNSACQDYKQNKNSNFV